MGTDVLSETATSLPYLKTENALNYDFVHRIEKRIYGLCFRFVADSNPDSPVSAKTSVIYNVLLVAVFSI